jgi:hypothetical protein
LGHKALNETKVKLNRGDTKVERVQAFLDEIIDSKNVKD